MKPTIIIAIALLFLCPSSPLSAQDSARVVIISCRVGEEIDGKEREYFRLFPAVKNFVSAVFYQTPDSKYYARLVTIGDDGKTMESSMEYSDATLFIVAEKINHFEALVANDYTMGTERATIQIVDGPWISWAQVSEKYRQKYQQEAGMGIKPAAAAAETTSSPFNRMELRFSGGYGFPKEGIPLSNYDMTSTYSSSTGSLNSKQNVKDKYFSMGQGIRFELGYVFYFEEHTGIFAQIGYSSGSESSKETNADRSYYSGIPDFSSNSVTEQTLTFSSIPLIAGLHFRSNEGLVRLYGGVGAGVWFNRKLASRLDQTYTSSNSMNNSRTQREIEITTNTPVAYVGYVGCNISLAPNVALFVEAKSTLVSFYVTREEVTKYFVNDNDRLGSLKTLERVAVFEEDQSYTGINPYDLDQPYRGGPPLPIPASSLGITVGLSLSR